MNTTKSQIFENQAFGKIRTFLDKNDEPWFCLIDVCTILDLNSTEVARRLGDEVVSKHPILDRLARMQMTTFVNEDGLYDTIFDSRKPEAKAFRKWVTKEVLPSIRKHGVYATDAVLKNLVEDPENAIALFKTMKAERDAKQMEDVLKFMHENVAEGDEAGFDYCKKILSQKQSVKVSEIASDYGMSEGDFVQVLSALGIFYGNGKAKKVCAKCLLEGYAVNGTSSYVTRTGTLKVHGFTLWTQKGRIFLYENLKAHGVTPVFNF